MSITGFIGRLAWASRPLTPLEWTAVLVFALAAVGLTGFAAIKRPISALFTFVALLPFHSLLITILLAHTRLPLQVLKLIAGWKEGLLVVVFTGLLVLTFAKKRSPPLVWVDWIAACWLAQVLLYFVGERLIFGSSSSLLQRLYGARDWMLYLLPYFIGRLMLVSEASLARLVKAILIVGVLTSLVGIAEYVFIPTQWHIALGVPRYFSEFLNIPYNPDTSGLPPNYWVQMGPLIYRRAVSVWLSGQGFALPFLVIWPVAVYMLAAKPSAAHLGALLVCGTGLLLSLTRMTIAVGILQGLILLLLLRRRRFSLLYLGVTVAVAALVFVVGIPLRTDEPGNLGVQSGIVFLANPEAVADLTSSTVKLQDSSSRGRPQQWIDGLRLLWARPFGMGLGITGQTGARFGQSGIGAEAGYLKLTGALGVPGLIFFLGWFLGVLGFSFAAFRSNDGEWRGIALLTLVIAIGFLMNDLTAPPDQSTYVIYLFPWLAGMTVRQATLGSRKRVVQGAEQRVA